MTTGDTLDFVFTVWRMYLVLMCTIGLALIFWSLWINRATLTPRERNIKRAMASLLIAGATGCGARVLAGLGAPEWLSFIGIVVGLVMVTVGSFHVVYALTMSRYR